MIYFSQFVGGEDADGVFESDIGLFFFECLALTFVEIIDVGEMQRACDGGLRRGIAKKMPMTAAAMQIGMMKSSSILRPNQRRFLRGGGGCCGWTGGRLLCEPLADGEAVRWRGSFTGGAQASPCGSALEARRGRAASAGAAAACGGCVGGIVGGPMRLLSPAKTSFIKPGAKPAVRLPGFCAKTSVSRTGGMARPSKPVAIGEPLMPLPFCAGGCCAARGAMIGRRICGANCGATGCGVGGAGCGARDGGGVSSAMVSTGFEVEILFGETGGAAGEPGTTGGGGSDRRLNERRGIAAGRNRNCRRFQRDFRHAGRRRETQQRIPPKKCSWFSRPN